MLANLFGRLWTRSMAIFAAATMVASVLVTILTGSTPAGAINGCAVQRITNLSPGSADSMWNDQIATFRGKLFFSARNEATDSGFEPHYWDGDKVRLLKNIDRRRFFSSFTTFRSSTSKYLFFTARGSTNTGIELWVTNGTTGGTRLVKDLTPGSGDTFFREFAKAGDRMYFTARDNIGDALWVSDGTRVGTKVVRRFSPGTAPSQLMGYNGKVYFAFRDSAGGTELWSSAGTAGTTRRLIDLNRGTASSFPRLIRVYNGRLYFTATRNFNQNTANLWSTDGTARGTRGVKNFTPGSTSSATVADSVVVGGKMYMWVDNDTSAASTYDLWVTSGSARNTRKVADINSTEFTISSGGVNEPSVAAAQGWIFYQDNRPASGAEWWAWKGGKRKRVTSINPGSADSSNLGDFAVTYKGSVYVTATNPTQGRELWRLRCP